MASGTRLCHERADDQRAGHWQQRRNPHQAAGRKQNLAELRQREQSGTGRDTNHHFEMEQATGQLTGKVTIIESHEQRRRDDSAY